MFLWLWLSAGIDTRNKAGIKHITHTHMPEEHNYIVKLLELSLQEQFRNYMLLV